MSSGIAIGDSVLVRNRGNEVPGVVEELADDRVFVRLAEPYVNETGESQSETWCSLADVTRILDDADRRPELPA